MTVSDQLLERLRAWGVQRIYGYPGDGINGLMAALERAGNDPEFIQSRHEETAALMACGHAKFTGHPGVCLATSGPGAIHLLNGLYDAKLDHQPVVAIVGQQARTALGGDYQQEVDLHSLFKDVAHEYVQTIMVPEQVPSLVDRALRIAIVERCVTCLIVPADVQNARAVRRLPQELKSVAGSVGVERATVTPSNDALQRAAAILNEGQRVAILVGQGARGAADEVVAVAERLGAGVAKALLGKDVLPDDLPFVTGGIGLLGTFPTHEMMQGCDTLLMVGSSFPYVPFLPPFGQARGIQIDIDGRMIGIRYPMELNLVGDARSTLQSLLPLLEEKPDRTWRAQLENSTAEWREQEEHVAQIDAEPLNPRALFRALSRRLPDRCLLAADSGSGTFWYARDIELRRGMRATLSGTLASMGSAVPYAIAAKLNHPDRCVVALVGDGAMQMNGMAELLTVAHYWHLWKDADPRFIVVVLHNNDLNLVSWEMRAMQGAPKFEASQRLPECNYAAFAEMIGLRGVRVDSPQSIDQALDDVFDARGPVVLDAVCDANVPPLPPHVTWEQSAALISALMRGDPDAGGIIRQIVKNKVASLSH